MKTSFLFFHILIIFQIEWSICEGTLIFLTNPSLKVQFPSVIKVLNNETCLTLVLIKFLLSSEYLNKMEPKWWEYVENLLSLIFQVGFFSKR